MPGEEKARSTPGRIRRLRAEDALELAAIAAGAPGAAKWSADSYQQLCRTGECLGFVHESEGQITGFILGRRVDDEVEVLNLAVRAEERKKGIGGRLLQGAMEELSKQGVARIYLEVRESNTEARRYYQNHGFTVTGARPNYYREPDEAAVLMEKKLTG